MVTIYTTVRDKKGKIVTGLQKDDFLLKENDRPQTIRHFSAPTDDPLTMGLIVDTTPSEASLLDTKREATYRFLRATLRPGKDRGFVIQYAGDIELLQDVTASTAKLEQALLRLDKHETAPGEVGSVSAASATILSDAIYLAADEVLKNESGRKAIVVLTDGDHIGLRQEEAIAAAKRANTAVYAVVMDIQNLRPYNPLDLSVPGGPSDWPHVGQGITTPAKHGSSEAKERLHQITKRTGGESFVVSKRKSLDSVYRDIEDQLHNQYSFGYSPQAEAKAGYRRIDIAVKQSDLVVETREGYYAASRPLSVQSAP